MENTLQVMWFENAFGELMLEKRRTCGKAEEAQPVFSKEPNSQANTEHLWGSSGMEFWSATKFVSTGFEAT